MCMAKTRKVQKAPPPPQTQTTVTSDEAVMREQGRERRRAASRYGRQSTILAGDVAPPTGQTKTMLGA